jgi:hypothetical protein
MPPTSAPSVPHTSYRSPRPPSAQVGTRSADLPSASHPQASSARAVAGVWPLCRELARAVVHRSDSGGRRRNAESPTQRVPDYSPWLANGDSERALGILL